MSHSGKSHHISFQNDGKTHCLEFATKDFCGGKPIEGRIDLADSQGESMVIAIPFAEKPDHFYFNQEINYIAASGAVCPQTKANFREKHPVGGASVLAIIHDLM